MHPTNMPTIMTCLTSFNIIIYASLQHQLDNIIYSIYILHKNMTKHMGPNIALKNNNNKIIKNYLDYILCRGGNLYLRVGFVSCQLMGIRLYNSTLTRHVYKTGQDCAILTQPIY